MRMWGAALGHEDGDARETMSAGVDDPTGVERDGEEYSCHNKNQPCCHRRARIPSRIVGADEPRCPGCLL